MAETDRMKRALAAITRLEARLAEVEKERREPIAIVSMSCRLPGGGNDLEAFWRLVRDGQDAVVEVPPDRWEADAWYDPDPEAPGKMYAKWGGYLQGYDPRAFDAQFFGIAPREAIEMDPQQRLLLELAWEALEAGGQPAERLAGSRTGVFVGISTNDYTQLESPEAMVRRINAYSGTGNSDSVAAGRISYVLGLEGPNVALDTSCSASLVAVHLACQSLRLGECDLALAGGVNLILAPYNNVYFSKLRAMSPDGRCKSFDAAANGYTRGEGCGIVLLKRLSRAQADGDPIVGVVRGSAINHDGRSNGLTAPSGTAQQAVLRAALAQAGVEPAEVAYVETHGTGTALGDPIEAEALAEVLGAGRGADRPVHLGAVKTNLGHLEAAAGIAGLIKLALVLDRGEIPPIVHLRQPSPFIPWERYPLALPAARSAWPEGRARVGGVSSFGFSGTNAHVILEAPPRRDPAARAPRRPLVLLPLSARHPAALGELARAWSAFLRGAGAPLALEDLAYTAAVRRSHHEHRLAVVGASHAEIAGKLESYVEGSVVAGLAPGGGAPAGRKVAFVFSGQGSQWLGMGRRLFELEPAFRDAFLEADRAVSPHVGRSLVEELEADAATSRLDEIEWLQPVLFAIHVALASLWRSWGVEPDAVVGHSMGEIAAVHVAGALPLAAAARIVCLRSRMLRQARGAGSMLAVELGREEAERLLRGYEERVSVAVNNGPAASVLSGETAAVEELARRLEADGVWCRPVPAAVASHSPHMERFRGELVRLLDGLAPGPLEIPFYSTAVPGFGRAAADGLRLDSGYWWSNLRQPVLFYDAVKDLERDGHGLFVEISPNPILAGAVARALPEARVQASMRRDEDGLAVMLENLGGLYGAGYRLPWEQLYPEGRCVGLPPYPWQRMPYWITVSGDRSGASARPGQGRRQPCLGRRLEIGGDPPAVVWETELSTADLPLLDDHRVHGTAIAPASLYLEMALEGAVELFGDRPPRVRELEIPEMLAVPDHAAVLAQLELVRESEASAVFAVRRRHGDGSWALVARGRLEAAGSSAAAAPDPPETAESPEEIRARARTTLSGDEYYRGLKARGYGFGPRLCGIERVWLGSGEALARLRVPDRLRTEAERYRLHPALVDACFQVVGAAASTDRSDPGAIYLVAGLAELHLRDALPLDLWCHARVWPGEPGAEGVVADLEMFDDAGRPVAAAAGLRLEPLGAAGAEVDRLAERLFEVRWLPADLPELATPPGGLWLLYADRTGVAGALAACLERGGHRVVRIEPAPAGHDGTRSVDPRDPDDFRRAVAEAVGRDQECRGAVHLSSLDLTHRDESADLDDVIDAGTGSALHLLQALVRACRNPPRLWLVTRGAQPAGSSSAVASPVQAALWGLGRTAAHEHPELLPTLVDLDPAGDGDEAALLAREVEAASRETQVAFREGQRRVARLVRGAPELAPRVREAAAASTPFVLRSEGTGTIGGVALAARRRTPPGPGQVEIEVASAALNFRDVLTTLGAVPAAGEEGALGTDCAGVVAAVGAGVDDLAPGDPVIAVAPGAIGSHVVTARALTIPKPASLGFDEAATLVMPFLTAYHGLVDVARLGAGETVLVHAGAGGVGMAAIQIARSRGARVLASAGSAAKRELLRGLGVEGVVDSRSLGFLEEVRSLTAGRGVDVVLNSLAGPFLRRSLECLAPFGRFVEIGRRDFARGLRLEGELLLRAITVGLVDVQAMCRRRPEAVASLLAELGAWVRDGRFQSLPYTRFPIARAGEALELMARGGHVGRCVIALDPGEARVRVAAGRAWLRDDQTYLLAGGLGALGRALARAMVRLGARHLVIVGRSAGSAEAALLAAELERDGAAVACLQADVADLAGMTAALATLGGSFPRLAGVVHLAGVLDDGTLLHLDRERLARVLRPKVEGARVLDALTRGLPLDFFVLYASAAGVLGSPGQGNYASANAALDALAHARRARGLAALAIDWGPFVETGVSSENLRRVAGLGMGSLEPEEGVEALARLVAGPAAQAAIFPLDVRQWLELFPKAVESPFLSALAAESGSSGDDKRSAFRERLAAAPAPEQPALVRAYVIEQIAQVLRLPEAAVAADAVLRTLGLDSLMALELRNRLETGLGLRLPATLVWAHPTAAALGAELAGRLGIDVAAPAPSEPVAGAEDLTALSEEALASALAEELRSLEARRQS